MDTNVQAELQIELENTENHEKNQFFVVFSPWI